MTTTEQIERVSLAVEIDGAPYFVALSQEKLRMVVVMASHLSDSGNLPVIKAPNAYKFQELEL